MNKGNYICTNCGSICDKPYKRNSTMRELMWIVFIFISMGLALIFYIIYKLNNRVENCCPCCKAENTLVPINSPRGQELSEKNYNKEQTLAVNEFEEDKKFCRTIAFVLIGIIILFALLASI